MKKANEIPYYTLQNSHVSTPKIILCKSNYTKRDGSLVGFKVKKITTNASPTKRNENITKPHNSFIYNQRPSAAITRTCKLWL